VMAIWLAALDLGSRDVRLPRRLIYVVDRRAVVDQATEEAEQLAAALGDGKEGGDHVITALRARLRLETGRKLPISTLRGQLADNRAWLEDPSAPAIVVGTVDMIGSRLLFQGYNVSTRMRPTHAALLGADALIVLDEAHLVPPFEALVRKVAEVTVEDGDRAPFKVPELRVMTLSATGRGTGKKIFTLQPEDEDAAVRERLGASKWLDLKNLPASADLAETMAQRAWERGQGGRRVIVFCDSRKVAQAVYDDIEERLTKYLKEQFGKEAPKSTEFIQLMVGARRVREREELARSKAFKRFSPKSAEETDAAAAGMPAFLAASSAGEVGVDVDADHMICDLVAWERMVQRLGRVNRLGKYKDGSFVDVFSVASDKDKEAETPAGIAQIETWRAPFDSAQWSIGQDRRRSASPGALRQLRNNEEFKKLTDDATTLAPLHPKLTRAHVDAWSMTSLDEHPGRPDVGPWIRGWIDDEPQTRVVWRRHLPIRANDRYEVAKDALGDFFEAAPLHLSEALETYTYSVVDLMRVRAKSLLKGSEHEGDALEALDREEVDPREDADAYEDREARLTPGMFVAVVLTPARKIDRLLRLREIEDIDAKRLYAMVAGRTVILDARMGGLANTGLLDAKENRPPATLDEKPITISRDALPDEETDRRPKKTWLWDDDRLQKIGFRVRLITHNVDANRTWKVVYQRFVDPRADEADDVEPFIEWRVEDWVCDGAARAESALARMEQKINLHHERTKWWAEKIASRLALADELREALVVAAGVHDSGKARRNWQAYAGNPSFARDAAKHAPLAKFTKRGNPNLLKIGEATYRHEFGSLRDSIDQKAVEGLASDRHDFAFHLIAAHHGNTRPVITPADELDPPTVSRQLAHRAALRFARLQSQWGPWGLAWYETLLRAADVAASREVDEPKGKS
jgi:CRISPR-associated endonuclease/helicase Cas3